MAFLKEMQVLTAFTEWVFPCNLYVRTTAGLLRSVRIPFTGPLFYGINLFEWDFSLTTKCEWELG